MVTKLPWLLVTSLFIKVNASPHQATYAGLLYYSVIKGYYLYPEYLKTEVNNNISKNIVIHIY